MRISDDNEQPRAWLLLTFGENRQYAGNKGYEDDPERVYHYDSNVPNYRRIKEGDIVLLRGTKELLGIARIERIESYRGNKERLRCSICGNLDIERRKKLQPPFRCKKGHTFDSPTLEIAECLHFKAHFESSFIPARGIINIAKLRKACPNYSRQLAMQLIDLRFIADQLVSVIPETESFLNVLFPQHYLDANTAEDSAIVEGINDKEKYKLDSTDRREIVTRSIRARRGQQAFRQSLIERYGPRCMVSGCELLDIVEAAHISPYRGPSDQHEENGLLLRADIHCLFDLDLMGIEPNTLKIHFHPITHFSGYQQFEGQRLNCNQNPSAEAIKARWALFCKRVELRT